MIAIITRKHDSFGKRSRVLSRKSRELILDHQRIEVDGLKHKINFLAVSLIRKVREEIVEASRKGNFRTSVSVVILDGDHSVLSKIYCQIDPKYINLIWKRALKIVKAKLRKDGVSCNSTGPNLSDDFFTDIIVKINCYW